MEQEERGIRRGATEDDVRKKVFDDAIDLPSVLICAKPDAFNRIAKGFFGAGLTNGMACNLPETTTVLLYSSLKLYEDIKRVSSVRGRLGWSP